MFINYKNKYLKYKKKYLNINKTVKPVQIKLKYFNGGSMKDLSNDSFLSNIQHDNCDKIIHVDLNIFYNKKMNTFSFPFYVNQDTPENVALELVELFDPCGTQLNLCEITTDIHNYIQAIRPGLVYISEKEEKSSKKEISDTSKPSIFSNKCLFWAEFGKCSRGDKCSFRHSN